MTHLPTNAGICFRYLPSNIFSVFISLIRIFPNDLGNRAKYIYIYYFILLDFRTNDGSFSPWCLVYRKFENKIAQMHVIRKIFNDIDDDKECDIDDK